MFDDEVTEEAAEETPAETEEATENEQLSQVKRWFRWEPKTTSFLCFMVELESIPVTVIE